MRRATSTRAFVVTFALVAVAQFVLVVGFNVVVDPRAEFPTRFFRPLVAEAAADKTMLFRALDETPSTLILGSSRAWSIPTSALEGGGFNFAVSGGTARDALLTYRFVVAEGRTPATLLWGVEDWSLRPYHASQWDPARDPTLLDVGSYAGALVPAYSWDYVEDSLLSLRYHREGFPPVAYAIQADGHVVWEEAERAIARGSFDLPSQFSRAQAEFKKAYDGHASALPELVADFDALLSEASRHGTRVVLVLTPMLPEAVALAPEPAFSAAQAELTALLDARCGVGVEVYDLRDPAAAGLTTRDFVDGWHLTERGGARLVEAIARTPDRCAS